MTKTRNILKQLAAMEDLAQGVGTTSQLRGGTARTVHKVDVPVAVETQEEMEALDVAKFTRARVYSNTTTFTDYIYDVNATSGVASTGPGYWVPLRDTDSVLYLTVAQAQNSTLVLGQRVVLTDRAEGIFKVTTHNPNTYDIIDIGNGLSLTLENSKQNALLEYLGVVTGDDTDWSAAINRLVTINNGHLFSALDGAINFSSTISSTGQRKYWYTHPNTQLLWTGEVGNVALAIGDGTTLTQNNVYTNITVTDGTIGTAELIKLDAANRNEFYSLKTLGTSVKVQGAGLVLKDSIINDFFKYKSFGPAIGVQSSLNSFVVANNFYGIMLESHTIAGLDVPANSSFTRNNFYGGTVENCSGDGVRLGAPVEGLLLHGIYFELNNNDLKFDNAAAGVLPVKLDSCRFKSAISGSAIRDNGVGNIVIVNDSQHDDCTLVTGNQSTSRYKGTNNRSRTASDEVSPSYLGRSITKVIDSNNESIAGVGNLKLHDYNVPVCQQGTVVSLASGASTTVTFPKQFINVPVVLPNVDSPDVTTISTTGVNLSQVTFRNRGASQVSFSWVALDSKSLNP